MCSMLKNPPGQRYVLSECPYRCMWLNWIALDTIHVHSWKTKQLMTWTSARLFSKQLWPLFFPKEISQLSTMRSAEAVDHSLPLCVSCLNPSNLRINFLPMSQLRWRLLRLITTWLTQTQNSPPQAGDACLLGLNAISYSQWLSPLITFSLNRVCLVKWKYSIVWTTLKLRV